MHALRRIIMYFEPGEAEETLSGSVETIKRHESSIATGDIIYVYTTHPRKAVLGEFVAGLPEFTRDYEHQLIPVLWPRKYEEPLEVRIKGLGDPPHYVKAPERLLGFLESRRCKAIPHTVAVVYGVEECVYCRSTLALLRDVFGYGCVEECDVSGEECFDKYEALLRKLFPGGEGVPLSIGRYGGSAWAAYGGLNVYDLENIYRALSPGSLIAYRRGATSLHPLSVLENSSSNTL